MKRILIDSSFYIALIYSSDSNHRKAQKLVRELSPNVYTQMTTEDFLKETLTIISQRVDRAESIAFYNALITNTQIISITPAQFQQGLSLFLTSTLNKNISLIDCIASVIYHDIGAYAMVTFDPHFKTMKVNTLP